MGRDENVIVFKDTENLCKTNPSGGVTKGANVQEDTGSRVISWV